MKLNKHIRRGRGSRYRVTSGGCQTLGGYDHPVLFVRHQSLHALRHGVEVLVQSIRAFSRLWPSYLRNSSVRSRYMGLWQHRSVSANKTTSVRSRTYIPRPLLRTLSVDLDAATLSSSRIRHRVSVQELATPDRPVLYQPHLYFPDGAQDSGESSQFERRHPHYFNIARPRAPRMPDRSLSHPGSADEP